MIALVEGKINLPLNPSAWTIYSTTVNCRQAGRIRAGLSFGISRALRTSSRLSSAVPGSKPLSHSIRSIPGTGVSRSACCGAWGKEIRRGKRTWRETRFCQALTSSAKSSWKSSAPANLNSKSNVGSSFRFKHNSITRLSGESIWRNLVKRGNGSWLAPHEAQTLP